MGECPCGRQQLRILRPARLLRTTQVVIEKAEMMQIIKGITKESTIQVTVEIEVVSSEIKVLGKRRHRRNSIAKRDITS